MPYRVMQLLRETRTGSKAPPNAFRGKQVLGYGEKNMSRLESRGLNLFEVCGDISSALRTNMRPKKGCSRIARIGHAGWRCGDVVERGRK